MSDIKLFGGYRPSPHMGLKNAIWYGNSKTDGVWQCTGYEWIKVGAADAAGIEYNWSLAPIVITNVEEALDYLLPGGAGSSGGAAIDCGNRFTGDAFIDGGSRF